VLTLYFLSNMKADTADYWIKNLELLPHPEGGYYREIFSSNEIIDQKCLPQRFAGSRKFYTSIYFLLKNNEVSHFHRIKSDEIWCFHAGKTIEIHEINKESIYCVRKLGLNPQKDEMP